MREGGDEWGNRSKEAFVRSDQFSSVQFSSEQIN